MTNCVLNTECQTTDKVPVFVELTWSLPSWEDREETEQETRWTMINRPQQPEARVWQGTGWLLDIKPSGNLGGGDLSAESE